MEIHKIISDFINLDWESLRDMLLNLDPKNDTWYMVVINKGQPSETRTKFLTFHEVKELISFALEKKRLRVIV